MTCRPPGSFCCEARNSASTPGCRRTSTAGEWRLARVAQAEGKVGEALKLMRAAADEEDAIEKRPVTPGAIVPAREQLGDLLLETNHPREAIKEFERALTMTPQRRGASMGLAHAREMIASAEPNKN